MSVALLRCTCISLVICSDDKCNVIYIMNKNIQFVSFKWENIHIHYWINTKRGQDIVNNRECMFSNYQRKIGIWQADKFTFHNSESIDLFTKCIDATQTHYQVNETRGTGRVSPFLGCDTTKLWLIKKWYYCLLTIYLVNKCKPRISQVHVYKQNCTLSFIAFV